MAAIYPQMEASERPLNLYSLSYRSYGDHFYATKFFLKLIYLGREIKLGSITKLWN